MSKTLCLLGISLALVSCTGGHSSATLPTAGDTLTHEANLLTLVDYNAFIVADIASPWDSTAKLQRLVLYPRDHRPDSLPDGVQIPYPVTSSIVYSSVHAGAIEELGATEAVTAVADAEYYKLPFVVEGLNSGKIVDVGSSMSPSQEKVLMANPDAILASPFQGATHPVIDKMGIPIVEMADYLETSPLGRAEWIKLLGYLYGKPEDATRIFDKVKSDYVNIKEQASGASNRPRVLTETPQSGIWYVPGGQSYMARLLADAGFDYPWKDDRSTGSIPLDPSAVLDKAHDATVWLIKSFGTAPSRVDLIKMSPVISHIEALKDGRVYYCDTEATLLFEDFPFHPERLLLDFQCIASGNLNQSLKYYRPIER